MWATSHTKYKPDTIAFKQALDPIRRIKKCMKMFPCMHASLVREHAIICTSTWLQHAHNHTYWYMIAACMHTFLCTGTRLQYAHITITLTHWYMIDCSMHKHVPVQDCICPYQYMVASCTQSHTLVQDCSMHTYVPVNGCSMHTGNHTHWYMIAACTHMHPKYMAGCRMHAITQT